MSIGSIDSRGTGEVTGDAALQLVSRMLWAGVLITAPLLIITMLVGILISIFQVVTQIQEVSLSFIPKILTVVLVLAFFGPWMLKKLVNYSASVIASIPAYL
jgi:flagellar biosynthetic protein FliQ